jgi:hypothetical protein
MQQGLEDGSIPQSREAETIQGLARDMAQWARLERFRKLAEHKRLLRQADDEAKSKASAAGSAEVEAAVSDQGPPGSEQEAAHPGMEVDPSQARGGDFGTTGESLSPHSPQRLAKCTSSEGGEGDQDQESKDKRLDDVRRRTLAAFDRAAAAKREKEAGGGKDGSTDYHTAGSASGAASMELGPQPAPPTPNSAVALPSPAATAASPRVKKEKEDEEAPQSRGTPNSERSTAQSRGKKKSADSTKSKSRRRSAKRPKRKRLGGSPKDAAPPPGVGSRGGKG